ncbi:MCE family protein [Gordonia insulae]|uniref:Lipoprotein LprN n=1 Tax=Gordonia insulae TaxID=2420509 RepID=A0A3G8JNS8_9ACTN|nr:MCE family protein [Gordonia insulae]AZG45830.1 Lipoprotein LprN [Gordonia insulae]
MPARLATARLVAIVAVALLLAGCGVGLSDLPLPKKGSESGNTYTLRAEFANALNLPQEAKVKLNGADVGSVQSMSVRDYVAVVSMHVQDDVRLPVGTRAELRSATPLGDVFVALQPPREPDAATGDLADGDTIALKDTGAATTVEEILSTSALLVNGGVLRDLTTIINGLGRTVGDRGDELSELIARSTRLISSLSARSGDIRNALRQTDALVSTVSAQEKSVSESLAAAGPALDVIASNSDQIITLVNQVGQISTQLSRYPSIATGKTQHLVANLNTLSKGLNDAATAPGADLTKMNALLAPVIKITNSTAAHVDADLEDLSIGALPDPRHRADPGARLPDLTDVGNVVGTITYTLERLRKKLEPPR